MTAQVADTLVYEGRDYRIAAIENEWPFNPQDHGFEPRPLNTGCWRGYYCQYSVIARALSLTQLNISTGARKPPPWQGVEPQQGKFLKFDRSWEYAGLQLPIAYSGGVVVGCDFLREFYVHMGFHRPHCYQTVLELVFQLGQLKQVHDHSRKMEQVRQRIREQGAADSKPSHEEIERFVDEAFSLSYGKKWRL